ncbi:MAG TPA: phage integrase N-terminal SAM-like domain-containing protein [Candidatus Limnocylindrales bacterium]
MSQLATGAPHLTAAGDLEANVAAFGRHLRAANLSPATIKTYREAADVLARYLGDQGMPTDVAAISREHVEAFVTDLLARRRPATAANRYRGLQRFFAWLVDEGEIKASPMARMRPPHVPEAAPPVLADDELKRLLATSERGTSFEDRRDAADPGVHRHRRPEGGGRRAPLRAIRRNLE